MSVQVQLRRDTLANILANNGALGEVFVSTDTHGLFIQDGATHGGFTPNGTSPARAAAAIDATSVPHGGNISFGCQEELLTALSGATKVSTITFPNPCLILGCSARVMTAITGATSFNVGRTGGTANEFGNVAITAGTTNSGLLGTPNSQFSSVTVTLTAVGANFTAGAVRIQLAYILLNPPTS
ncbi:MAG: hypothetical protein M3Z96_13465 [Pseudomonadota bacterium]|nr:hypothetical protein [Pseudomonadota bacterium]